MSSAAFSPEPTGLPRKQRRVLTGNLDQVLAQEAEVSSLSDVSLRSSFDKVALQVRSTGPSADLMVRCFALTREVARRVLGEFPYPVQVLGGLAMAEGAIVEMATGEGKTLTAALPVVWFALRGGGVHLATANDYLAQRDAETMSRLYSFLGLTTGVSTRSATSEQKQAAYLCDVTYSTAQQLGFDYLGDNLVDSPSKRVQRKPAFAVVDEADSLLIDEARTPLVISSPDKDSRVNWAGYAQVVNSLAPEDLEVDLSEEVCYLTPSGTLKVEKFLGVENIYAFPRHVHHVQAALSARALFRRDVDYVVAEDASGRRQVVIVDTYTGRVQPSRRFQNSIHEAIEAKEGVQVKVPDVSVASVSVQAYFGRYPHLCGMTGTAAGDAEELESVYGTPVVRIPTHRPVQRVDEPDVLYATRDAKLRAVVAEVERLHALGQPVLLGTPDVGESEDVSDLLVEAGLGHSVLNARRHEQEAHVVAQAGRLGAITVATNMAGRGVDIKLGGDPVDLARSEFDPAAEPEEFESALDSWRSVCQDERQQVLSAGGLAVVGTARYSSRRIDDQLRGRSGRQGEPGMSRFFLSCEDDIVKTFGGERIAPLVSQLSGDPDLPVSHRALMSVVERSQRRVEKDHADERKSLLSYDKVFTAQREAFYTWRESVLALGFEELLEGIVRLVVNKVLSEAGVGTDAALTGDDLSKALEVIWPLDLPSYLSPSDTMSITTAEESLTNDVVTDFTQRFGVVPEEVRVDVLRNVFLQFADTTWATHLLELDVLRSGGTLHSLAQQDPRVSFSLEAHELFEAMLVRLRERCVHALWRLKIGLSKPASDAPSTDESEEDPTSEAVSELAAPEALNGREAAE